MNIIKSKEPFITEHHDLQKLSKQLIDKWKKEVDSKSNTPKSNASTPTETSSKSVMKSPTMKPQTPGDLTKEERLALQLDQISGDRSKIRILLYKTVRSNNEDSKLSDEELADIVNSLENEIHNKFEGDGYTNQCRTIKFHLSKNKNICFDLLSGQLAAETLASYSANDFLSDDQKKADAQYRDFISDSAIADVEQLKMKILEKNTKGQGLLECPKCHSMHTNYYEKQTRSADEPMTVFGTCYDCGKHWRQ